MPRYRYSPAQLEKIHGNPWLTDRERAAFELHYRRGWAIEDVAAELDVSRGTVNNDLASIRRKICRDATEEDNKAGISAICELTEERTEPWVAKVRGKIEGM